MSSFVSPSSTFDDHIVNCLLSPTATGLLTAAERCKPARASEMIE